MIRLLNIGCGHDYHEGWINLDCHSKGRIEILADLETGLPFKDESVDYVYASHILEHIKTVTDLIQEVHRILKTGGHFEIYVPYGMTPSLYHVKYFFLNSMDAFIPFVIPLDRGFDGGNLFVKVKQEISKYDIPGRWHLEHYFGIDISKLPLSRPRELHWILEKI